MVCCPASAIKKQLYLQKQMIQWRKKLNHAWWVCCNIRNRFIFSWASLSVRFIFPQLYSIACYIAKGKMESANFEISPSKTNFLQSNWGAARTDFVLVNLCICLFVLMYLCLCIFYVFVYLKKRARQFEISPSKTNFSHPSEEPPELSNLCQYHLKTLCRGYDRRFLTIHYCQISDLLVQYF